MLQLFGIPRTGCTGALVENGGTMCVARDFGPCCGLALWTLSIWALVIRPMAPPAINVVVEALEFPPEFWIVEIDGVPARISLLVPAIWPRAR